MSTSPKIPFKARLNVSYDSHLPGTVVEVIYYHQAYNSYDVTTTDGKGYVNVPAHHLDIVSPSLEWMFWAKFTAIDMDGSKWAYENKPYYNLVLRSWESPYGKKVKISNGFKVHNNWYNTLEER